MIRFVSRLSDATLRVVVYAIAVGVCVLVVFIILNPGMLRLGIADVSCAPHLHALLNGTVAILLSIGYVAIRTRHSSLHRVCMLSAFVLSTVFLVSYVIYHTQKIHPVYFHGTGVIRFLYMVILSTHVVLAAVIVPLALLTIARAWRREYNLHRRIAQFTLPVWLYVALSGVAVYIMLYAWPV